MLLAPAVELLLVACTAVVVAAGDGEEQQPPVFSIDAFAEPERWERHRLDVQ